MGTVADSARGLEKALVETSISRCEAATAAMIVASQQKTRSRSGGHGFVLRDVTRAISETSRPGSFAP